MAECRWRNGYLISVKKAAYNVAISTAGNIIVTEGINTDLEYSEIIPSTNTVTIPGYTNQAIIAKFSNSNSGIGLPSRYSVADNLGISTSKQFRVKFTIMCSAKSTQSGGIYGRNTTISGMSSTSYPQRLNNNGGVETDRLAMAAGDIDEFMLVWDGTDYYAYWLNHRN